MCVCVCRVVWNYVWNYIKGVEFGFGKRCTFSFFIFWVGKGVRFLHVLHERNNPSFSLALLCVSPTLTMCEPRTVLEAMIC